MHSQQPENTHRQGSDDVEETTDKSAYSGNAGLRVVASNASASTNSKSSIDKRSLLLDRQALTLGLIAEFLDQSSFDASLTSLVLELQHRFRCDRVVIGLFTGSTLTVKAISQQSTVDLQSSEVRLLMGALQEACDQDQVIYFPEHKNDLTITLAHGDVSKGRTYPNICTIPLCDEGKIIGALLFDLESAQGWSKLTIDFMQQIADIMAPLINLRRCSEQKIIDIVTKRARKVATSVLKPEYLVAKCLSLLIVLILTAAHFLPVTHQIKTTAEIVPLEKRLISSPSRGYLRRVGFKNGETIKKGDLLVKLDTRDLELERVKLENEIHSAQTELRASMASHNRKDMAIAQAKLDQAQSRVDLINKQISRSTLLAPVDGIIINGDLQQSIGAPVERGETLLEVAPSLGHKAYLLVAETEIDYISIGQAGQLKLKSAPGSPLNIVVKDIHPIAVGINGANRFRIEAEISTPGWSIKPGQTGIAKLNAGETNLLWSVSHKFTNWLRLHAWEWFG